MRIVTKELPSKAIIGMIHVPALPGSILFNRHFSRGHIRDIEDLIEKPLQELKIYGEAGIDAVMIENMHDIPYSKSPLPDITVDAMVIIAKAIRAKTTLPVGIQMLEAANCEAMEIACSAHLDFIRAEGYVYAHIGGAGIIEGSARKILEIRKKRGYPNIKVFADVKKKHCAHALTADLSLGDIVRQSEFFLADGVIVTGSFTGNPVDLKDLSDAKKTVEKIPVLIGSGITAENLRDYYTHADGFIVGSYFKKDGDWKNDLDLERIKSLVQERNRLGKI